MTFDLSAILASKRRYRAALAARPVAEKLRMLDALRERTLALRRAATDARGRGDPRVNRDGPSPAPDAADDPLP
jgi:hypothetical protein